jgi:hypothetical protein
MCSMTGLACGSLASIHKILVLGYQCTDTYLWWRLCYYSILCVCLGTKVAVVEKSGIKSPNISFSMKVN